MQVIETIAEFRAVRRSLAGSLGFVPTMGYLHDGHIALVRQALAENDAVAVSIFVNPTQFGPNEDFNAYPRKMEHDMATLGEAKASLRFAPTADEMYPQGCQNTADVSRDAPRAI